MSAESLREALRAGGLACEVEARDRLAVIRSSAGATDALADADRRARTLILAAEHGFTHAAIELAD